MEHHEIIDDETAAPLARSAEWPSNGITSSNAFLVPPSPPSQPAAFRSQRINFAAAPPLVPPLLQPNPINGRVPTTPLKTTSASQDDSLPLNMAKKREAVGTIPFMPSFHIRERTAIGISEDRVSLNTLLDRILQYLRDQSISYECEPDTGCFDCMAPSMVGFAVQLWRDNKNSNKQICVEVQRREGCALALNAIRRNLLRHVQGEPEPAPMAGRRRPIAADPYSNQSNKRQRSHSHAARMNCRDALTLTLRLLESPKTDQQKLGLESLCVMTNARLVSPLDVALASRSLVVGDSPDGARLQQRMGTLLREFQPALTEPGESYHPSPCALLYHVALHALANALEQVSRDVSVASRVNLNSPFWQTVVPCLLFSLNGAGRSPHEAALSAKCLRFLVPAPAAAQRLQVPATQASLRRTIDLGRAHHVALAEESQKTLSIFH